MHDHHLETQLEVLVTPADVAGQWTAHCLNLDVVTQGDSIQHAFAMALEAVRQVVDDDLRQGLDPLTRSPAPESCWAVYWDAMRHGRPLTSIEDPSTIRAAVSSLLVTVRSDLVPEHAQPPRFEVGSLPPVWQRGTVESAHEFHPPG